MPTTGALDKIYIKIDKMSKCDINIFNDLQYINVKISNLLAKKNEKILLSLKQHF